MAGLVSIWVWLAVGMITACQNESAAIPFHCGAGVPLTDEIVLSPECRLLFALDPQGALSAFQLDSGQILWQGEAGAKPVLAVGQTLFAWQPLAEASNQLTVWGFHVTDGTPFFISEPLSFPDWVVVSGDLGHAFALEARKNDSLLMLDWEARAWYAGGANPSPEILEEARRFAAGAIQIDPNSGSVAYFPAETMPGQPGQDLPRTQSFWWRGSWQSEPLASPNGLMTFAIEIIDDRPWLVLSGQTETSATRFELEEVAESLILVVTSDQRHLLVFDTGENKKVMSYSWRAYDLANGQAIGDMALPRDTRAALLEEETAFFFTQENQPPKGFGQAQLRRVGALDLVTGTLIWRLRLQDPPIRIPPP